MEVDAFLSVYHTVCAYSKPSVLFELIQLAVELTLAFPEQSPHVGGREGREGGEGGEGENIRSWIRGHSPLFLRYIDKSRAAIFNSNTLSAGKIFFPDSSTS